MSMYSKFVVQFIVSDKKAACAAISGYVKARRRGTVMDCNIECCTGRNCNDGGNVTKKRPASKSFLTGKDKLKV